MKNKSAFPRPYSQSQRSLNLENFEHMHQDGMTLREYYAGLAMQGLITHSCRDSFDHSIEPRIRKAVLFADALIAELEKSEG